MFSFYLPENIVSCVKMLPAKKLYLNFSSVKASDESWRINRSILFLLQNYKLDEIHRCMKSVRIRSFSGPYFPAFGLIFVSLRIQSKCGKIRTGKTPNTYAFHAVPFGNTDEWIRLKGKSYTFIIQFLSA